MKHIIIIIAALNLTSCGFITKRMLKMKKIKTEPIELQKKYLLKNNLDTSNLYQFKEEFKTKLLSGAYPMYTSDTTGFKPIQTRFFNQHGEPISHWASCYGDIQNIIGQDSILPRYSNFVPSPPLKTFMQNLLPYNSQSIIPAGSKITIISIWAEYLGTISLNRLIALDKLCSDHPEKYIHLKVNLGEL